MSKNKQDMLGFKLQLHHIFLSLSASALSVSFPSTPVGLMMTF